MSVRVWAEPRAKEDMRSPGIDDMELKAAAENGEERRMRRRKRSVSKDTVKVVVKEDQEHAELLILGAPPGLEADEAE